MTRRELDDLICRLMLDAARLEYGQALAEGPEHDFSPAFQRRMRRLLRRGRHPAAYRALRAAACLALALVLSGCTVLAVSPEARTALTSWVREMHATYSRYEFFGDRVGNPLSEGAALYQPAYVPDRYRIEYRSMMANGGMNVTYVDDEAGTLALFSCIADTSSFVVQITWENEVTYKEVQVNGITADLYLDSEEGAGNTILWVDEDKGLAFQIYGVLDEEELIGMARSVRAIPRDVIFRPAWLPEGYGETSAVDCPAKMEGIPGGLDAGKSVLSYEVGKGGAVRVIYAHEYEISGLRTDVRGARAVPTRVGGDQAFLFLDQAGTRHLVWVDGDSGVFFWISGPLAEEELVRIAESMEMLEQPP